MSTHILITGAGGFIGQALATALLTHDPHAHLTLTDIAAPPVPASATETTHMTTTPVDLTSAAALTALLTSHTWTAVYLLHGIMSAGAEADLEAGLRVNLDSHRACLDTLRAHQPGVVVVFPSSTAVYGPCGAGEVFTEATQPRPRSSYGTQKLMVELLIDDYSRRGLLDGRVVRLPTVLVRPGKPTAAASSFASGIVREPMQGVRAVLPVRSEIEMWICSPATVVENLVRVKDVEGTAFGDSRVVNLPGVTVTVGEILAALEKVGGREKRELVVEERDPVIERMVESWPAAMETGRAYGLGFKPDGSLEETVRAFADGLKQ